MSVSVLLLSVVFAGIEAAVSWLMLAFEPVSQFFAGIPLWLITAIVFALGMLLSFVLILFIGATEITDRAADFVRDHFGRALALMLASAVLVFGLAAGGEALYQIRPSEKPEAPVTDKADICFILDFSISMDGAREAGLKQAFADALNDMDDGQRISVVRYDSYASVLYPWHTLDDQTRAEVIGAVNAESSSGGTSFDEAFETAAPLIDQAVAQKRLPAAIMISDGEDSFSGFESVAPTFLTNAIKVYTVGIGNDGLFGELQNIANMTGGRFLTSGESAGDISVTLSQATTEAGGVAEPVTRIPDTLLTARHEGRPALFNPMVLRILLLLVLSFVFKLIVNVCIGNNDSNLGVHLLTALIVALLGTAVVEFGYRFGLPMYAVEGVYWLLMMAQIVRTDR